VLVPSFSPSLFRRFLLGAGACEEEAVVVLE
jgi:hypothetical protein